MGGCTQLGELQREPVACAVLNLRGGGRHHKAKEKAVYQDKVFCFSFSLSRSAVCTRWKKPCHEGRLIEEIDDYHGRSARAAA